MQNLREIQKFVRCAQCSKDVYAPFSFTFCNNTVCFIGQETEVYRGLAYGHIARR